MKGLKRKISMLLAVVLCFTTMFTNITITAVADWIPQPGNLVWVDEINLFSDTVLGETEMKMYLENKEVVNNALLIRGKTVDVEVKSNAAITAGSLYLLMSGISNYIKVDLTVSEDKLTATGSFNTNDVLNENPVSEALAYSQKFMMAFGIRDAFKETVEVLSLETMEFETVEFDYEYGTNLKDKVSKYIGYMGENKPDRWVVYDIQLDAAEKWIYDKLGTVDKYICSNNKDVSGLIVVPEYDDKAVVRLIVKDSSTNKYYYSAFICDKGEQALPLVMYGFDNLIWNGYYDETNSGYWENVRGSNVVNIKAALNTVDGFANGGLKDIFTGKDSSFEAGVERATKVFEELTKYAKLRKKAGVGDGSILISFAGLNELDTNPGVPETLTKLIAEAAQKSAEDIAAGREGDPFVMAIDFGDETIVPDDILKIIKGIDADIVLEMKDRDEDYSWTINGNDITAETPKDINLEVNMHSDKIDDKTVENLAGDNDSRQISLTHEGQFGFKATLKLFAGLDYAKKVIDLIWVKADGTAELIESAIGDAMGYVNLGFEHASNYLLVVNNSDSEKKEEESKLPEETTIEEIKVTKDTSTNTAKVGQKVEVGTNDTAKAADGAVKLTTGAATQLADVITDAVKKAKDTADAGTKVENTVVTIDLADATVVPVEILEAAKGKDVEVVLEMKDGDTSYSWAINGADITADTLKEINLEVKMVEDVVKEDTVKELAGDNASLQMSLTHEGEFGFDATLKINVGKEHSGKYINLYWVKADGTSELIEAAKVDKNGDVELEFKHASDYLLVVDNVDRAAEAANTPNTGDTLPVLPMACMLFISMVALVVPAKKKMDAR